MFLRISEFLLCLLNLLLWCLSRGVPALLRHFGINLVLNAKRFVKRLLERAVYVGGGRFYRAVHKNIARVFNTRKNVVHNDLVLHIVLLKVICKCCQKPFAAFELFEK